MGFLHKLLAWIKGLIKNILDTTPEYTEPEGEIMFRRVRELINRGHQLADKADQRLDQSKLLLDLVEAFVDDLQDGAEIKFQLDDNAARKFLLLLSGKAGDIPVSITIDPAWDAFPSKVAEFRGGPYDGKKYTIPNQQVELVLEGGHRYKWNGRLFQYQS